MALVDQEQLYKLKPQKYEIFLLVIYFQFESVIVIGGGRYSVSLKSSLCPKCTLLEPNSGNSCRENRNLVSSFLFCQWNKN